MPMKTWLKMAVAAGILLSGTAVAEECQITVSQNEVNYNQIRRDDIVTSQQGWNKLAEREVTVNVSCPQTQQMAVLAQGAAGEKGRFLFGSRGGVGLKIDNVTVDGKSYKIGKTVDQVNFTPKSETASSIYLRNNEAVIAIENNVVPEGKQMSFTATLFPVLNDSMFRRNTDIMDIEADIVWQLLTK